MPGEIWLPAAALAVEACLGYPQALYARIAHPVVWIGKLIETLERRWNDPARSDAKRKALGIVTMTIVAGSAGAVGYAIQVGAQRLPFGMIIVILIATMGLAQRSLYSHVRDVLRPLARDDVPAAREAVSKIVGRDTAQLTSSGVSAAAIESLAESFNDGIVAPAFWLAVGGLPGLFAYKALNTADSLIGHREPRWRAFGWAAARADDVANLIPARLAGLLIVIAGGSGLRVMWRNAPHHASPNAGWPEAAMAGALQIELGGPATYEGVMHERPSFGTGRRPDVGDLRRALQIYLEGCALLWALALALAAGGMLWPR
ncbi:MAG TPA: adenosylcobinamide-phosphate synthase CbiB [Steroidobacteraceae bacterium]|nr:adenosylcobinamide-phosphate synthase CbiB [Steroidobacteraceae bacterium]